MRISWNWLRSLLDTDTLSPQQAAEILTSTGLEVESCEPLEPVPGMLAGVVVGAVRTCERHPDADRLHICTVDLGQGNPVQIVCGAPNVATGQKVLVATVGTTLHPTGGEPFTIKKSKIRGAESHGMICAADELGLGTDHDGIVVLDPAAVPGTPAAQQLNLRGDHVLEIGLTPNRSDALGHWGVARDLGYEPWFPTRVGIRITDDHLPLLEKGIRAIDVIDFDYGPRNVVVDARDAVIGYDDYIGRPTLQRSDAAGSWAGSGTWVVRK